ncbi:class III lanthionine synthetase LanKC [Streptomyces sp. NPDC002054]|uniref:class III lanthionine synthetase LanKC n=1 Tax=Streptomyces sp. NPDC002054 TaxID=3154663 RepID=UPI003332A413
MDILRHLHFCPPGTPFFDLPARVDPAEDAFPLAHDALPEGWSRTPGSEWVVMAPPGVTLPKQGWKIHVSATLDNAAHLLDLVAKYCVAEGVMFKFIRSPQLLRQRNGKYGDRSGSGKFLTVYPLDDAHFEEVLRELDTLVGGEPGPYILSDLRYRQGPLYVRYGGFVLQAVRSAETGELVYCIENPDGELVPDRRGPGFRPPEWVTVPDCLAESLAARGAGTLRDFPFRVTAAVHFSNGGGVYRGTDTRDGSEVLLREARPYAGLDADGRDAVTRHQQEHWALRRLAGAPAMPRLIDYRKGHEHYFLVREWVEGTALSKELMRRNPLLNGLTSPEALAEYTAWALDVLGQTERGVAGMHERGVVFGDLHPGNLLVRPDGDVVFIDFETAVPPEEQNGQTMGAVGFIAPAGYTGFAVDRYALGCLRLAMFAPLVAMVSWSPDKPEELLELITRSYPVPSGFAAAVRRDLGLPAAGPDSGRLWAVPGAGECAGWLRTLGDSVLATVQEGREDRLFPGDAAQFFTPEGGLGFAHGAAGVLWALGEAGLPVPEEHLDWLVERVQAAADPQPGFYAGLGGIAYALDRLGRADTARELVGRIAQAPLSGLDHTLQDGLAGVGLTLLHFGLPDEAVQIAGRLAELPSPAGRGPDRRPATGLLRGSTGTALFLLRLYEHTGDGTLLDRVAEALRTDLAGLGWQSGEPFGESATGRIPVIGAGSGGTGMVLHDLLAHRPDEELAQARDAILAATELPFLPQAGLLNGRAGAILTRVHLASGRPLHSDGVREPARAAGPGAEPPAVAPPGQGRSAPASRGSGPEGAGAAGIGAGADPALERHLAGLGINAVPFRGGIAFLGQECLRISADLATGSAGVLLALTAALSDRRARLPFF